MPSTSLSGWWSAECCEGFAPGKKGGHLTDIDRLLSAIRLAEVYAPGFVALRDDDMHQWLGSIGNVAASLVSVRRMLSEAGLRPVVLGSASEDEAMVFVSNPRAQTLPHHQIERALWSPNELIIDFGMHKESA